MYDYNDENDLVPPDPVHIRHLDQLTQNLDAEISFLQSKSEALDREINAAAIRMSFWNIETVLEEAAVKRVYARGSFIAIQEGRPKSSEV